MTYLTRMVAFLITVFLGLFSVVGTPTWKREAPLRVAAYIVVSDVEAAKALDDSHLDDLTDIILIGNTGWFGTDGKLHMAEAFGDVAAWFRARTAKNHTKLLVTIGGPGASEGTDVTERFESQAANHKLAFDSGVLETEIRQMLETYALDGVNFDCEFPGTPQRVRTAAFLLRRRPQKKPARTNGKKLLATSLPIVRIAAKSIRAFLCRCSIGSPMVFASCFILK